MDNSPANALVILMWVIAALAIGIGGWHLFIRYEKWPSYWTFAGIAAAMVVGGFFAGCMMAIFWPIVLFLAALAAVILGLGFGLRALHTSLKDRHGSAR